MILFPGSSNLSSLKPDNIHLCNGRYLNRGLAFKRVPNNIVMGFVNYNGALSGSDKLFFHYGSGDNTHWANPTDIQMKKDKNGNFYACFDTLQPTSSNEVVIHAALHDGTGNWDNNSGNNYTLSADLKKFTL
jgi:hypothetical protein